MRYVLGREVWRPLYSHCTECGVFVDDPDLLDLVAIRFTRAILCRDHFKLALQSGRAKV